MAAESSTGVAAAGDEVGRLYAEYGAKLHRFCRGRLRSTEEAEDAVQTTFLRVYTALRQGTVPQYEAAWLYKIAHNVCLSRIESSERRARIESPQDFSLLEDELAAPTGRSDELVGLADALAAMPPNLRQAILLREWQGLSYAEISEALGVSVSAVESLIFRARRHLANALVEPAKKLAGALNLPWLAGAARALFANLRTTGAEAGLGMKIAAGIGLVAIGGGGAGVGLTVGASGHARPALTVRPAAASSPAAGVGAPAFAPRGEMAAVVAQSGAPAKRPAGSAGRASQGTPPASAPGQGDSPSPAAPGAPPTIAPTGDDPPATTPTPPGSTAPPATAPPPAAPKPKLPLVPIVPLPALPVVTTIPAVTVPPVTVTVPPVTVPPLPLPVPVPPVTVTVPAITTPTVTLP